MARNPQRLGPLNPDLRSTDRPGMSESSSVTAGQRIAGIVLIANGGFVIAEAVLLSNAGAAGALARPHTSAVDILLGLALLVGVPAVLPWVKFRVVAGALVFPGMYLFQGDPVMAGVQVAFSAAVALLLFGNSGGLRIATAGLVVTGLFCLELLGLQQILTGRSPLLASVSSITYDLEPLTSSEFTSEAQPYRIQLPESGWERRSEAAARADNPLAEIWLVQPEMDAHVLVIGESVDAGQEIPIEPLVEAVIANAREGATEFEVLEQKPLASFNTIGRRIDASAVMDGLPVRLRYGVFAEGRHGIQLICFAQPAAFEIAASECDAVFASFEVL